MLEYLCVHGLLVQLVTSFGKHNLALVFFLHVASVAEPPEGPSIADHSVSLSLHQSEWVVELVSMLLDIVH